MSKFTGWVGRKESPNLKPSFIWEQKVQERVLGTPVPSGEEQ
jgi:hypothetical protein